MIHGAPLLASFWQIAVELAIIQGDNAPIQHAKTVPLVFCRRIAGIRLRVSKHSLLNWLAEGPRLRDWPPMRLSSPRVIKAWQSNGQH